MSKPHRLIPVSPEDNPLLRTIFLSSWNRALSLSPLPQESKELVLNQQFELQHQGYQEQYPYANYDLVYLNDNPAGRIYVDRGPDVFVLIDITLLPIFRKQGLGSTLIGELIAEAQTDGKPINLHVEKWNPDARRLYQRLGFTDLADIGSHWKMQWLPE